MHLAAATLALHPRPLEATLVLLPRPLEATLVLLPRPLEATLGRLLRPPVAIPVLRKRSKWILRFNLFYIYLHESLKQMSGFFLSLS